MVIYPTDWKESSIGDLFNVFAGGDVKKQYFSKFRTSAYPYEIFSNGIENRGHYGYTSLAVFPGNSVTVTARGTIGQAFYREAPYDAIIRLLVLSPKSENIKPKFYEYYINNQIVFERENTGVPQLTAPKIKEKTVPFFDGKEQEKIIETLQVFDTYIDDLAELIEKKKGIRDGALKDLISGRIRLDGYDYEWQEGKIGDVLKILHGKNQRVVESFNGKYPILGTGGIIGKAMEFLCDWECVLIGRKGTIDNPMYMNTPFWTIDTLYYSKPADNQCVKWQYYLFCTIDWYDYTESSGRPSLAKKVIEAISIKIPQYEEQVKIAAVLTAMDEEIRDLETEREKIIQIREGAMDDLLTGRVRLTK